MSSSSWLKNFIDEDIYVFGSETKPPRAEIEEKVPEKNAPEPNPAKGQKEAAVILSDEELETYTELLTSILSTLGHTIESVEVINQANDADYKWVIDFNNNSENRYTLLKENYPLIYSASLSELDKDRELKLALWSTIKELKNLQTAG